MYELRSQEYLPDLFTYVFWLWIRHMVYYGTKFVQIYRGIWRPPAMIKFVPPSNELKHEWRDIFNEPCENSP